MRRRLFYYLVLAIYFFTLVPVFAQTSDSVANCDICGYCNGGTPPSTWEKCVKCVYPDLVKEGGNVPDASDNETLMNMPTPHPDKFYTMMGCLSTEPSVFTTQIAQVLFSIIGGIAFLYLLYGSSIFLTSRSDPEKLSQGKRIIVGAIVGLLFVLLSVFIIRMISVNILRAPGFSEGVLTPEPTMP